MLSGIVQGSKCPCCSEELPKAPSDKLLALILAARDFQMLGDDCTYDELNKMALNTSETCRQHRFENTVLPLAEVKGWPTQINFHALIHEIYTCQATFSLFWSNITLFSSYQPVFEEINSRPPGMNRLQVEERIMADYPPLVG